MKILLKRQWRTDSYIVGRLYLLTGNDERPALLCNTLEPPKNGEVCCIPAGEYEVTITVKSPKYSKKEAYGWCSGFLPRLRNVPGRAGILIHAGNTVADTRGCILVGNNVRPGYLNQSMLTLKELYRRMKQAYYKGETITIKIEN